jgi:hypothetical protein
MENKSMLPLYCWHTYDAVNSTHTECAAWKNKFTLVLFSNLDFLIDFHKIAIKVHEYPSLWSRGNSADVQTGRYDEVNTSFSRLMRTRLTR